MNEKEIESIIMEEISCLEQNDVDSYLKYFTEDVNFYTSQGIFKGKDEVRKFVTWLGKDLSDLKLSDEGVGLVANGNKAVYQYLLEAIYKGIKISVRCMATYEFYGDKIKNHWVVMDRLSLAKQAAKGPVARKIVNLLIAKTDEGLH
jgi:hypothetical protein